MYIGMRVCLYSFIDSTGTMSKFHAEAPKSTASEGLAQGPYVTARAGFEPGTLRTKFVESTNEPPSLMYTCMFVCMYRCKYIDTMYCRYVLLIFLLTIMVHTWSCLRSSLFSVIQ